MRFRLPQLLIVALLYGGSHSWAQEATTKLKVIDWRRPTPLKSAIEYLPTSTFSVVAVRSPLVIRGRPDKNGVDWYAELSETIRFGLPNLNKGKYYRQLAGNQIAFVIQACRRPSGASARPGFHFNGCQLVAFSKSLGSSGDKMFSTLRKEADQADCSFGHDIAVFRPKQGASYFICRPKPDLLLVGTELKFVQSILYRIVDKSQRTSTVLADPVWNHIDADAQVFVVAHRVFAGRGKKKDFALMASAKETSVKMRFMADKEQLPRIQRMWTVEGRDKAKGHVLSPEVVQVIIPITQIALQDLVLLSSMLGYSVFGDRLSK